MEDLEEWIHEANECVHINLTRPSEKAEPVFEEAFNPEFTYPILGDEQKIIGYKDPRIAINFRANDLKPTLDTQFEKKIDLSTLLPDGTEQVDIETAWQPFLPSGTSGRTDANSGEDEDGDGDEDRDEDKDEDEAADTSNTESNDPTSKSWTPPGELAHSFKLHGKKYEIWKSTLADPAALAIWNNMQVLVLLFIEGASLLDLDEDWIRERWTLYLLYDVSTVVDLKLSISPYTIAGFSTTHRSWIFPSFNVMRALKSLPSPAASGNGDASTYSPPRLTIDPDTSLVQQIDTLQEPSRERISQFLILPPFQGLSLGATLYEAVFGDLVKLPNIFEIPVEDPNENFDKMRDYADMEYLRRLPAFKALSITTTMPPENLRKDSVISRNQIFGNGTNLEALRLETKIVKRQFNRLIELHLLSTIPPISRNKARITRKDKASNENDRKFYFWRLAVKQRIYQQHADALSQIEDTAERAEKVEGALENQLSEYIERLEGFERRLKVETNLEGLSIRNQKRKRTVVVDDEDDEWEDVDEGSVASSKRARNQKRKRTVVVGDEDEWEDVEE